MYQRRHLRYSVHFRSTLSTPHIPESTGTAMDLSIRGCRVQSLIPVIPDLHMKLLIDTPAPETTVEVEEAVVRWVSGQEFGVEFSSIAPEQFERLTKVIQQLPADPNRSR